MELIRVLVCGLSGAMIGAYINATLGFEKPYDSLIGALMALLLMFLTQK